MQGLQDGTFMKSVLMLTALESVASLVQAQSASPKLCSGNKQKPSKHSNAISSAARANMIGTTTKNDQKQQADLNASEEEIRTSKGVSGKKEEQGGGGQQRLVEVPKLEASSFGLKIDEAYDDS